jgi:hypothetical protein
MPLKSCDNCGRKNICLMKFDSIWCNYGEQWEPEELRQNKKMSSTSRLDIRLTEEEKQKARKQAERLGLDISGYIKLIINLDAATGIIKRLGEGK